MITFKVDDLKNMNIQLRAFADFLRSENISDDDIFASRLVSCELITNVIRHSGEPADFKGELMSDRVVITVTSSGFKGLNFNPSAPDVFAESGRGLYIIKSICWGDVLCGKDGDVTVTIKRH